ncbi:hypothetical protein [Methylobacterium planeticum]|uniref:DUF1571 domain-containing protein n=1 Tax=Methylobacterium planeticum TaxID=2615211 RepID=A0A6N6ML96_9HYPH|nr:hypothetical protein [Methylobacterium planeticum]KAB1071995.1 hypothetical protein F6X51_17720 [Methylobacterium planeticum]
MKDLVTAAILALTAAPALAQGTPPAAAPAVQQAKADAAPAAADLLFERPQMRNTAPGATLTYDYLRRSGILKGPFGPPLNDAIKLRLEPGRTADERNISVEMFSGQNRFPAGPFEDMPGNPVMSLFLEHHLKNLARVLEANPRYLKNAIRKGLRDGATVTPTKVRFNGREVDAWRIEAKPFEGDKLAERMRGLSNLTYTFVTSPEVPGEVVSIEAQSKNAEGGELLEERLSYDQNAG